MRWKLIIQAKNSLGQIAGVFNDVKVSFKKGVCSSKWSEASSDANNGKSGCCIFRPIVKSQLFAQSSISCHLFPDFSDFCRNVTKTQIHHIVNFGCGLTIFWSFFLAKESWRASYF